MKKIIVILLLFCYLIPAIGLSVKQHYCRGKLTSVSIIFTENPSCPCGKKPMKKNCCKDKTTVLKLTDTQNISKQVAINLAKTVKVITPNYPVYNFHFAEVAFERHLPFDLPIPLQKSEPLYLLNGVFLI